jgi:hydroxyacylglutathione hydrolase
VQTLKERFGATVIGPKAERDTIPGLDFAVVDGDPVAVGGLVGRVLETPGHTKGHIVFLFEDERLLFSGDTLFVMGCGRPFECDPPVLWESMLRLRALPDDIAVYCGHEYTLSNARFAASVDPDNAELLERLGGDRGEARHRQADAAHHDRRGKGRPTPSCAPTMPTLPSASALPGPSRVPSFTELRSLKNSFRG